MADQSSAADRTEKPTPKRIRDARKRGEVPRSRELVSFAVVAAGVLTLIVTGGSVAASAVDWMARALSPDRALLEHPQDMVGYLGAMTAGGFRLVLPVFGVGLVVGLLAPMLLGGWNVSGEALQLKFDRLDPVSGFGRVFSRNSLVELGKALLKALVLGAVFVLFLRGHIGELMALGREPVGSAMGHGLSLAMSCLMWMTGGLFLIAAVDAPYQIWSYHKRLRMTKQEVKQEFKESEGSPEVKGRLRRLQQEVAQRRMMEAVPGADVVVVNPTHYAVALKYDPEKMRAPRVVAKGVDLVATAIRDQAGRYKVPILSAPPLARALYRTTRLDDEIPTALYAAVAQVLTYIFQMRRWRGEHGQAPPPVPPRIDEVPHGEADA